MEVNNLKIDLNESFGQAKFTSTPIKNAKKGDQDVIVRKGILCYNNNVNKANNGSSGSSKANTPTSICSSSDTSSEEISTKLTSVVRQVKFTEEPNISVVPPNEDKWNPRTAEYPELRVAVASMDEMAQPTAVASADLSADSSAVSSAVASADQHEHHEHRVQFTPQDEFTVRKNTDSSYEGWDNPFRPEGELSQEAEELLWLWKQGRMTNSNSNSEENTTTTENTTETDTIQNGKTKGSSPSAAVVQVEVKRENVSTKAQHVDKEQKKKAKGCCSVM